MDVTKKYEKEFDPFRHSLDGLYSITDKKVLYYCVRELSPKVILDLGPRSGATTSTILAALVMNKTPPRDIQYFIFEKDKPWLDKIKEFTKQNYPEINFHFYENVIDDEVIKKIPPVDLLFIDANHDYILAKWYIDNLFPLAHDNSLTHIHDIYYNKNGNGWRDVGALGNPQNHPDIINPETHKELYPTIYDKYATPAVHSGATLGSGANSSIVARNEEDEIRDYCMERTEPHIHTNLNKEIDFFSTGSLPWVDGGWSQVPNCSFYIWKKNAGFNIRT